jgi:hypothetical protein
MVCAVLFASWINGHLDFGFLSDRFGLMYVSFALLGWGGHCGVKDGYPDADKLKSESRLLRSYL